MVRATMSSMGERGRGILTRMARGESGYGTLTAVLVLLILGALVITPILVFMDIGLDAGQTHERRTDELYAADAGVNYALWQIKMANVPTEPDPEDTYCSECPKKVLPEFPINDKDVNVTIWEVLEEGSDYPAYRIVSVATTDLPPLGDDDNDTYTTVESYVTLAYSTSSLLDAAITSLEDAEIKSPVVGKVVCGGNLAVNAVVEGDVLCGGDLDVKAKVEGNVLCAGTVHIFPEGWVTGDVTYGKELINKGILDGDEHYSPGIEIPEMPRIEDWPKADIFRDLYGGQVSDLDPYPYDTINVVSTPEIPRLRTDIDQGLVIESRERGVEATLSGTVYVAGENSLLTIGGPKDFTLDLNEKTIFCEGEIRIDESCIIKGTGVIIAVGDVFFGPQMVTSGGEEDYVIIMSIEGWTDMHPLGDFNGSVVGNTDVELYPGCTLTYMAPDTGELNFPIFNTAEIITYNIYN